MPAEVATLAVGLVLNTGKFFGVLGMTLNTAASKMTMWGLRTTAMISAPFIALTAITGRFAVEFDKEMRNVNASLQLPEPQFAALRKQVIDLSMTSRSTAVDIARSLLMVSQAGLESEEAWHLVEIATHAAGAAFSTTAQTSRFLIATMRAYDKTLEDTTSLMDQAIFASQKGAGSFDDIANAVGLIAPMAATAGISFEELLGAMRTLRVGGLNASTAMVSLQGVVRKIIMPTEEMKAVFEATGYESGIAALEVLGLDGVIRLMTRAAGGSADKMAELFNDIRAARGAFILMKDDATGLTRSIELLGDEAAFEGAMERAREQQYKSLDSQVKRLRNTMMAFGLSLWEVPMPALVALVDWLRKVALGFMGLSDQTKQWIIIAVAAAAALGPVILLLGKMLSIGAMIASVALNPLVLALAAVAFAAYKWITARYHIENLQDAVVAFSDIAVRALDWVSERLVGMVDLIGRMAEWGAQAIGAFAQGIVSGLGLVVQAINYVVGGIAALLGPGSPPAALPNIVKWGQSAINEFLQGMTMADFSILDELGGAIESHLRALKWESADALSAALIRARVALARVLAEASASGEASAEAWADLRREIGDTAGEMEQYLRARVAAAQAENELAQAEVRRKQVTEQLEEEKHALELRHKRVSRQLEREGHTTELRHKEELREVDEEVKTAEEALADFREQTAEIPERFTRGRRKQLEVELRAAQKEQETIKDRQEIEQDAFETRKWRIGELHKIEKEEFETRKRHVMEEVDAQVEAAQARRELAKKEADWLGAVIKQKQKIVSLYKEEKEGAEGLALDLSELTPEALDIGDAIGGIKTEFDKAKEAAAGLFGVWKAFWAGLTGVALDEELKGMTAEERRMYQAGLDVNEAWETFTGVLDKVRVALQPIVDIFQQIFGGEGVEVESATFEEKIDSLIDGITLWLEQKWPRINAILNEWAERFWGWVSQAILDLDEKLTPLLDKIEEWVYSTETQNRLVKLGHALGEALVDALTFLLKNDAAIAKVLMAVTFLLLETLARVLAIAIQVGWEIALGMISGILEKLDAKNWVPNLKQKIVEGLRDLGNSIIEWIKTLTRDLTEPLQGLIDGIAGAFADLQLLLVGGSIVPDMIAQIEGAFGQMGENVAATGTQMVQGLTTGLTGGIPALTGALATAGAPGAVAGGFAGQIAITNYWDASLAAKDRAELAAMMETTVYGALDEVYGGA